MIEGYLTPNLVYIYILNMMCKHILLIKFLNESKLILLHTVKKFSKYSHISLTIQLKSFVYTQLNGKKVVSNNSVKHQSFVCTQFRCQTVLFDP